MLENYCLLPDPCQGSLVRNSFIAFVVNKTQRVRKPINYFITNMSLSIVVLHILVPLDSWIINGPLGQAL